MNTMTKTDTNPGYILSAVCAREIAALATSTRPDDTRRYHILSAARDDLDAAGYPPGQKRTRCANIAHYHKWAISADRDEARNGQEATA